MSSIPHHIVVSHTTPRHTRHHPVYHTTPPGPGPSRRVRPRTHNSGARSWAPHCNTVALPKPGPCMRCVSTQHAAPCRCIHYCTASPLHNFPPPCRSAAASPHPDPAIYTAASNKANPHSGTQRRQEPRLPYSGPTASCQTAAPPHTTHCYTWPRTVRNARQSPKTT